MLVISDDISNFMFIRVWTFLSEIPYVYFTFKIALKTYQLFVYGISELYTARTKDSRALLRLHPSHSREQHLPQE